MGAQIASSLGRRCATIHRQNHMKTIAHLPFLLFLTPVDFFLFTKVKSELAGKPLTQDTFKKSWEGAIRTVTKDDFTAAFDKWQHCCKKCN